MCIRDRPEKVKAENVSSVTILPPVEAINKYLEEVDKKTDSVSYTHLRAHETPEHLVCRLLLEKKNKNDRQEHVPPRLDTSYIRLHRW